VDSNGAVSDVGHRLASRLDSGMKTKRNIDAAVRAKVASQGG
jgi:hypothetical protein